MINQNLIIYEFNSLFDILDELKENFNFKLHNISYKQAETLNFKNFDNFIVISKNDKNFENILVIDNFPIKVDKLLEIINVKFLKNKFAKQSDINLGKYKLNLNSRSIYLKNDKLNLTEKETEIILFLKKIKSPTKIIKLQKEVWGHQSELETHTVETHIYRLRKKILEKFNDNNFIISSKDGYIIK